MNLIYWKNKNLQCLLAEQKILPRDIFVTFLLSLSQERFHLYSKSTHLTRIQAISYMCATCVYLLLVSWAQISIQRDLQSTCFVAHANINMWGVGMYLYIKLCKLNVIIVQNLLISAKRLFSRNMRRELRLHQFCIDFRHNRKPPKSPYMVKAWINN